MAKSSPLLDVVRQNLIDEMSRRNLTKADMSRLTGLSDVAIGYIVTGRRGLSINALHTIATALDIPPYQLLLKDLGRAA